MTRDDIAEIFDRVRTWPKERQERVAAMLIEFENAETDYDPVLEDERSSPARDTK